MNIAMFTNNYLPFIGGVPISIDRLANSLRKLGHNVYVFAPSYENFNEDTEGVIRCLSFKKNEFVIPNIFDDKIEENFKNLDIDIVHIHHPFLMGSVGVNLAKKYFIPVVYTYHTRFDKYLHNLSIYKALYKIEDNKYISKLLTLSENYIIPKYIKRFCNKCNMVIAPTKYARDYINNLDTNTPVKIVPTGLLENSFEFDDKIVNEIVSKYKNDKDYLFCTVSRISREKNIEFIINGLKVLKNKVGDNFNCMIIGEGPLKSKLEESLKELDLIENVFFIGSVENNKLKNYYKAADLFLFASKSETQGIVLLEAMAGETPVVAISSSGIDDLVKNELNGYKTKDDLDDWTDKIIKLMKDKSLIKECSKGAKDTSLRYTQQEIGKYMMSNYEYCLSVYNKEEACVVNNFDCSVYFK